MNSNNIESTIIDSGYYRIRNGSFTKSRVYQYILYSTGRCIIRATKPYTVWKEGQIPEGAEIIIT